MFIKENSLVLFQGDSIRGPGSQDTDCKGICQGV